VENFYTLIQKHHLLERGSTIVVGVSGGPDSLALLHLLDKLKNKWNLKLVAAHVDHMFRGEQSKEEMHFVLNYCKEHNITCEAKQINVNAYAKKYQLNSQVAARECRYDFFKKVLDKYQSKYLALGHHGDDQVETILMRMVRGSTGEALAGIRVKRNFHNGYIIRPMLGNTKEQILTYCREQSLIPMFDPSNEKTVYTRNRFRKHVLPFLKKENPLVHERFQHFSETLLDDESYLQVLTQQQMNTVLKRKEKTVVEIDINRFLKLPLPLQRRGIQLILNYLYENIHSSLSSIHIESLLRLLSQDHPSGSLDYPGGLKVIKSYQNCLFTFEHDEVKKYCFEIDIPSVVTLPNGYKITCDFARNISTELKGNESFLLNHKALVGPLIVRTREQGDKINLKGMNGRKKVKDIFIDEKIPLHSRHSWPIVEDGSGNILWLPGLKKSIFEAESANEDEFVVLHYKSYDVLGGTHFMRQDIEEILVTEEQIQEKVKELGKVLTEEYKDRFPLAVGVLKGAMPFMGDLLKNIDTYLEMDFMDVSSYGTSTVSSGEVKIIKDLDTSVEGRDILIIEDIIDSGLTLSYLVKLFRYRKANSIKIVTLLNKPTGRKADIEADYVGFDVPDAFVVGYGLDYNERYRNLPYIGVLNPEIYQ
jgi:tRNA(Ile)-lysidine synthase